MKVQAALAIGIACCLQAGCASAPEPAGAPPEEGVTVTGSRLPARNIGTAPIGRVSKDEWENDTRGRQVNPQGR